VTTDENSYEAIKERDKNVVPRIGGPRYGKDAALRGDMDRRILLKMLETIEKIVDEHYSIRSMDNMYPDSCPSEIQAVIDGTRCEECGGYPGAMYDGSVHFISCSKSK
jgi:hypothetical protein